MEKTYNPEVDELVSRLTKPFLSYTSNGEQMVVDQDTAREAAEMILELFNEKEIYAAEHYNNQIGG